MLAVFAHSQFIKVFRGFTFSLVSGVDADESTCRGIKDISLNLVNSQVFTQLKHEVDYFDT